MSRSAFLALGALLISGDHAYAQGAATHDHDHAGAATHQDPPPGAMHDMDGMDGMDGMDMTDDATARDGGMHHATGHMTGALGSYPINREASGTSWQPDASPHQGVHRMAGAWMLMGHGLINGVYDSQGGPRGGDKAFASGMVMGMAARGVGDRGRLQLRAMLSPDPFMGPSGYPLLLATGETGDGRTPLIDRQHPHDLFMELSASYSYRLSARSNLFLYAGLPGEPAFGPPAFMHRLSIMDSPEAPISHHWIDSMHITEGVVTGGVIHGPLKLEASGYKGREPDQHRYDIERPKLDSVAIRLSVNPTARLALQVSWARQKSPEQLDPDVNERRWSASAIYTMPLGDQGFWSTSAIWGQRRAFGAEGRGPALNALVLESALHLDARWTIYGRAERVDNDELFATADNHSGAPFTVGKVSLGAIRDFRVAPHLTFGLGAQAARNFVGQALSAAYGGDRWGGMGFLRLKID